MASSLASSGARGAVSSSVSQVAIFLIRMIGLAVLARIIAPTDFGRFVIVFALISLVMGLVWVGLPMAANQASDLTHETQSALMLINALLGLLVGLALFISAPLIGVIYGNDDFEVIGRWLAILPFLGGLQVQLRVNLTRQRRFGTLATTEVVSLIISTGVAITLAIAGWGVWALVAQVLVQAVGDLIFLGVVSRWGPFRPRIHREELRELARFGRNVAIANAIRSLSKGIIIPVAGLSVAPGPIANFNKAHQLAITPAVLAINRSTRVVIPILSALRDDPPRLLAYFRRAHLLLLTVTCTLLLILAGLSSPLINVLLGPGWELTGQLLQILAIGSVFRALSRSVDWIYYSNSGSALALRETLWVYPFVATVTLLGLTSGVTGMAIAYAAAWLVVWPFVLFRAIRSAGGKTTQFFLDAIRTIALLGFPAGLVAYGVSHLISSPGLALTLGAVASLASVGLSTALVPAVRRDIKAVIDVFRLGIGRGKSAP
jgi:PST family polysaccharide transporter